MIDQTDSTFQAFLEEVKEHLTTLETSLLALEEKPGEPDDELINAIFRAAHTIKGTAGFFGLSRMGRLAHGMENVLGLLRDKVLPCTQPMVSTLLKATDLLTKMFADIAHSETLDIEMVLQALGDIEVGDEPQPALAPREEPPPVPAESSAVQNASSSGEAPAPKALEGIAKAPSTPEPPHVDSVTKKDGPSTIRVNLTQLDRLMMLAGELVLTRNALLKKSVDRDLEEMINLTQRVDAITSQLQDGIMATRMQPVGTVFSRFRRVVRDLAVTLGKRIEFEVEGEDVELDKPLLEALADPLTHIVRNSADHGIESPQVRAAAGKPEVGRVRLHAFHEAGQVVIEAQDDGAGIDPERVANKAVEVGLCTRAQAAAMSSDDKVRLIFAPGFSTATQITDVSGRGVGMDVVATSIAKVGGTVDVRSVVGKGSTIVIRLPLTLAIIPSLLVGVGEECFAIPQVNLVELVRIPATEGAKQVERVGNATVMRLRGDLLPLVRLSDVLGFDATFRGPDGERLPERRQLGGRRAEQPVEAALLEGERRHGADRRQSRQSSVNVVVVSSGNARYGLLVDQLLDSEEIVVKPLSSHLKGCGVYAGATILGDGRVSLILDIAGLCATANVTVARRAADAATRRKPAEVQQEEQGWLVAENAPGERFGIPLGLVSRVERVPSSAILDLAGKRTYIVKETLVAVTPIEATAQMAPRPSAPSAFMVLCRLGEREYGIPTSRIVDVLESTGAIDATTHAQPGILGSTVVDGGVVLLVDVPALVAHQHGERSWPGRPQGGRNGSTGRSFGQGPKGATGAAAAQGSPLVLLVEDSPFFRNQIAAALEATGIEVMVAEDGEVGLATLQKHADRVRLVLTDIEMPKMGGLELTRRIRADARFASLPVVAVSTLSGTAAERHGADAGVTDYLVKLDREELLERTRWHLEHQNQYAH